MSGEEVKESKVNTADSNVLRIGDYITLKYLKRQSYLSSEGVINEDVQVSHTFKFFEEHLFQICVQRQYSATNELEEFTEKYQEKIINNDLDNSLKNHWEALLKGKANETVLNKNVMKSKTGNLVCLGDTIQLLHVKSRKFLMVRPKDLSRDEKENMKVGLSTDGSVLSWIKIVPRYKINRDGEFLVNNTEIMLKIVEKNNEFIHCADRPPPKGKLREVNSSMEMPTPWRITLYQRAVDMADASLLLAGELVSIRDPESFSLLTPVGLPLNLNHYGHRNKSSHGDEDGSESEESPIREFINENGEVSLQPMDEDNIETNAIWMIESKQIYKGGSVNFKNDKIRLRHFNTGKYLALKSINETGDSFVYSLVSEPDETSTMFQINQLHSSEDQLKNSRAIQLKQSHYSEYLERGVFNDELKIYQCKSTRNKNKALSMILNRYVQKKTQSNEKKSNEMEQMLDVYFGNAIIQQMNMFVINTVVPPSLDTDAISIWPKLEPTDFELFLTVVSRASLFLQGFPILMDESITDLSKFKLDKSLSLTRQNMLRDQGLVQDLLVMLDLLQPVSSWQMEDLQKGATPALLNFVSTTKEILTQCLSFLYELIRQNLNNQIYISDNLLVILSHVSTDQIAAKVAKELLSSNRELQEKKIGPREITIFAEKMIEIPMNAMYLQLLETCCSCLGEGVAKNQDIVKRVLFEKYKKLLIYPSLINDEVKVSSPVIDRRAGSVMFSAAQLTNDSLPRGEWEIGSHAHSVFIEPYVNDDQIRGFSLVSSTLPNLIVNWTSESTNFSPYKIFGRDTIHLEDCFVSSNVGFGSSTAVKVSTDLKNSVGDFFVSQLQLSAEMCLDRNYPVMKTMESLYSYEMLIIILKSFKNENLKSAAAYLILTLYIDRDPQSHVQLPKLTRVNSEIIKDNLPELVSVDKDRLPEFALLQYIIFQHLHEVKGKPFPKYTYNLMQILHKLISFHYYGDTDKLMGIIHLLVHSLKRDSSDFESVQSSRRGVSPGKNTSGRNSPIPSVSRSNSYEPLSNVDDEEEDKIILKPLLGKIGDLDPKEEEYPLANMLLEEIESLAANIITLTVSIASSAVTIYQFVEKADSIEYYIFNVTIFAFFAIELLIHFILHMIVKKSARDFIFNIYNLLDTIVVLLLAIQFFNLEASNFVKLIRILRLVVLFKLLESRRVEQKIENLLNVEVSAWEEPDRYIKTPEYTMKTLVKITDILCSVQDSIQDRVLIFLLKSFNQWSKDENPKTEDIVGILEKVFEDTSNIFVSNDNYDDIYIDLLMYSSPALVQSSLQLLMTHHSSRKILVNNLAKLQLITTLEGEEQFHSLEEIITKLKRSADKHEIWGKLLTPEHRAINDEMFKFIPQITKDCKKLREVLKFDETYEPVKVTQNILRNLGCFDLCMKIVKLIIHINPNDVYLEGNVNTRNLVTITNDLLYWFILDNPSNQALVFSELRFFIKTVDEKINSHKVIKAIFNNNITLMETVSKKHISEFAEMIVANGKFPQYLALMSSVIAVGEKNVIDNQYEVIKHMSSPDNQKKVIQYFLPVNHPEYQKKIRLMAPFLDVKDVSINDLPNDLAYHLELLGLLSSCTLGKFGMTSIEAKVQSMFFFVDIIEAILDPNCLLIGRIKLCLFFYNSVIDVETLLPVLKDADCIWKFIVSTVDIFSFAKDELRQIEKNGWGATSSSRQKVEYVVVCAMMINGYFSVYYDSSIFRPEAGQSVGVERVTLKEHQANDLIRSLFLRISLLYEMVSPLFPLETHELFYRTLVTLNNCAKTRFVAEVENKHVAFYESAAEYSTGHTNDVDAKFESFTSALSSNDSNIKDFVNGEVSNFINKLESIPWRNSDLKTDVCFEPLLEKIIAHIRGSVQVIIHDDDTIKFIEPAATKTAVWILQVLRNIIENRWGMTIYERDDDGGAEQDEAVADLIVVYNNSGVTVMCLDLISKGIEVELKSEALKLLVGMLFKEGGAIEIQKTINHHLTTTASDMFFRTVRSTLQNLISWHKWNGVITLEEGVEPDLPEEIILVRTLQLFSEGHFCPNQDLMREQPNNMVSINLLDDLVQYLQALDPVKCRTSSSAEGAVAALVLEVLQGPCVQNQEYFALSTELLENINKKLRQRTEGDCDEDEEKDLKKGYIEILQALLEGQGKKTAVYERMLSVIHIDVLIVLCRGKIDLAESEEEESEESVALRVESSVLFQMLIDYRPSLIQELAIEESFTDSISDLVACIELVWRGELQRRFFNVPEICSLLASSTKDNFISNVKRSSPEDKLYGLLEAAKDMYNEIKHQQILKEYRVDSIFSRTNEDRSTWLSFLIVLVINGLFIIYYTTVTVPCDSKTDDAWIEYVPYYSTQTNATFNVTCNQIYLNPTITLATFILTILVIATTFFTLTLIFVVRVPVNYKTYIEAELGVLRSILYTAMDFSTMYYFIYICIAIVGIKFHCALTFLLLDFVKKSPTAQAVLQAVYIPRKQIFMTVLLTFILLYIFAMFEFFFLNSTDNYGSLQNVISLLNTFKFLVRWGFPYYSPENYMELDISTWRVICDILFFIVTALMTNILKGITIDTFVEIRTGLQNKLRDTTQICFICGIEKNTFNRTLDREAFRLHVKTDQNLWNYIYFIIFIWENDKDDDDGLETYVRKCVANSDLSWFPMNRAIRLAEHLLKGDVNSLRYKFRKDLVDSENSLNQRMFNFKDQISRSIARIEATIELDNEVKAAGKSGSRIGRRSMSDMVSDKSGSRQGNNTDETSNSNGLTMRILSLSGTNINRKLFRCLSINTITPHDMSISHPVIVEIDESGGSKSPFSTKSNVDSTLMSFDSDLNDLITVFDINKMSNKTLNSCINIQLLYGNDKIKKYIGGVKVLISDLLSAAESDEPLEVEFEQKEFELWEEDYTTMTIVDINEEGKSFIPESSLCTLSLSCAASDMTLVKWKKLRKGAEESDDEEEEEGDDEQEEEEEEV